MTHRGWGLKKVLEEIAKCDLICANCHAIEHYERGSRPSRSTSSSLAQMVEARRQNPDKSGFESQGSYHTITKGE